MCIRDSTRDLSGQCYGSMLLKLPTDVEQAKQAAAYMRAQPGDVYKRQILWRAPVS